MSQINGTLVHGMFMLKPTPSPTPTLLTALKLLIGNMSPRWIDMYRTLNTRYRLSLTHRLTVRPKIQKSKKNTTKVIGKSK